VLRHSGFIPLARPILEGNEKKYVLEALDSGWLTYRGRFDQEFERAASAFLDRPALATSSGCGALHVALLANGIGPGAEVAVPNLTFGATASMVLAAGATPVLMDVDADTWGLSRTQLRRRKTRRMRAVMPVHLYGEDAGDFRDFGMRVIEDACEAFGMVPPYGHVSCYSFYGNKSITCGEGGLIAGDLRDALQWRNGGFDATYRHIVPGLNYRMTNLQAAVALAQLERAKELIGARLRNAEHYRAELPGRGKWLFVVRTENPQALGQYLGKLGIETRPVFPPLHRTPAFRKYADGRAFPVSDDIWQHGLCLPTGPHVSPEQIAFIIRAIKEHEKPRHLRKPAIRDRRVAAVT